MFSTKQLIKKGLIWSFIDNVFLKGITFLVTIILARILTPEDFGLIGVMTIFIAFGNALTEGGMGNSIIRDNSAIEEDYNAVFYGNLGISALLYPLLYSSAPFIADFFENQLITNLIRVYGLSFIFTAFFNIQYSVLTKSMDFKTIALLNLPAVILGSIVGITTALLDFGVWSLVYLQLATLLFKALFYWVASAWKPSIFISIEKLKKHFNFGYKLMLSSLLDVCMREVYSLIIGKKFSITTLGFYNQARTFRNYPIQLIGTVIAGVSYPLLSKLQSEKEKVTLLYAKIIRCVFVTVTPLMLLLVLLAEPLFELVLTKKWMSAVPYFQLLAISGILTPIHAINVNIYKVFNRTDIFLKLEVIKVALVFSLVLVAFIYGIYGLLFAMIINSVIALFINTYYGSQFIKYSTKKQLLDMLPIAFTAAISYFIGYYLLQLTSVSNLYLHIFLGVIIFISSYIFILFLIKNRSFLDVLELYKLLLKKTKV